MQVQQCHAATQKPPILTPIVENEHQFDTPPVEIVQVNCLWIQKVTPPQWKMLVILDCAGNVQQKI